ncbi:hypothetical protein PC121_g17659 [Phytophthora cactorum]|uniref:non-specific serine/threonine protein kinase n=1 Tax=Phytophthora cactorum TaxID=29920 RepID=A0A8T1C965_9STRA|nr:hypothetical protein PC117_g17768 [Phytophthora cactorum]KAG3051804.1 hypothetical protein PC121_g17659 [Phytophthora cactorum]KAG3069821.1 hypothetical protein PC122_g16412 [Phytophthora cactorum]
MVLLFQRKDSVLSEESKRFVNSLPSTFINLFRKRRQLLPVWSSHKYCAMIKSTFLVYYRATKPEDAGVPGFWQQNTLKYLNLQNCKIKLIDDDSAGYVFCITPESGKGAIYFAADTEKDRAKFAAQAAAVQHRMPSLNEFTTHKLLGRGHYGRVILASNAADRQLYAIKEMKLGQVKAKVVFAERATMEWVGDHPFVMGLDYALARGRSVFLISKFMQGEQPHTIYAPEEIASCFERDFAGFDYVRPLHAGANNASCPSLMPTAKMTVSPTSSSRASTSKDMSECIESSFGEFSFDQARMSGNEQQCEDDNPEVELEAELDVDSVRIKI